MFAAPLIDDVRKWFLDRGLTDAVVGFSGGIDSTTTAMLLDAAGIPVRLVVCDCGVQPSSPLAGRAGAHLLLAEYMARGSTVYVPIPHLLPAMNAWDQAREEAATPIIRVAAFYGEAARLRAQGHKPVVVGTANMSEAAYLGFWGKSSDAAQDFYPLTHLTKAQVYELAHELGVPREAIDATPSGDLLYDRTDDHKMIGATYPQIDAVITAAENFEHLTYIRRAIETVDNLPVFLDNILRNRFKYDLPFPGFHISPRLERFRQIPYRIIRMIAEELSCTT